MNQMSRNSFSAIHIWIRNLLTALYSNELKVIWSFLSIILIHYSSESQQLYVYIRINSKRTLGAESLNVIYSSEMSDEITENALLSLQIVSGHAITRMYFFEWNFLGDNPCFLLNWNRIKSWSVVRKWKKCSFQILRT